MTTAAHDYNNCKERYCIFCFYIYLATHPEEQEKYENLIRKIVAPSKELLK